MRFLFLILAFYADFSYATSNDICISFAKGGSENYFQTNCPGMTDFREFRFETNSKKDLLSFLLSNYGYEFVGSYFSNSVLIHAKKSESKNDKVCLLLIQSPHLYGESDYYFDCGDGAISYLDRNKWQAYLSRNGFKLNREVRTRWALQVDLGSVQSLGGNINIYQRVY